MTASPPPLPARPPHALLVHFGVDSTVAFIATVFLGIIFSVPIIAVAVGSLVVGAVAAPYTRRAEIRALALRSADATRSADLPDPE